MANLKDITKLPIVESAEDLHLIAEVNGIAKRITVDDINQVKTVNGVEPDEVGNIKINALPNDIEQLIMLVEADMLPAVHSLSNKILTDQNNNVILRY